jgi:hypothetical protein
VSGRAVGWGVVVVVVAARGRRAGLAWDEGWVVGYAAGRALSGGYVQ